jgi:hypothetical protein
MVNKEKLSELFRRSIFGGLEKIDISDAGQRKSVYEAALNSLKNVHSKNPNLTEDIKMDQRSLLSAMIIEIENKIDNLNEIESSGAADTKDVSHVEEKDFLLDDDIQTQSSVSGFLDKLRNMLRKPKLFGKKLILTTLVALFALIGISAYYSNLNEAKNTSTKLPLPYVLNADQDLIDLVRPKNNASIRLADSLGDGIIYEVDSSDAEAKNRVDFVLRGEIGKKILAHDEPILVTFHIQKLSKGEIEFDFLFRGIGKSVRKKINIIDEETNEYFLVTNTERSDKVRSNALIRLQISPTSEKFEEKPVILLKKIVFSKI